MIFSIRIEHDFPSSKYANSPLETFWNPILAESRKHYNYENPVQAHRDLTRGFQFKLRRNLESALRPMGEFPSDFSRTRSYGLFKDLRKIFQRFGRLFWRTESIKPPGGSSDGLSVAIMNIEYGSLIFDLVLSTTKDVLEIFDRNEDLIRAFLGPFIIDQFADFYSVDSSHLTININSNNMIKNRNESAKFIGLILNASLLIPLGFSIYLWYNYQSKVELIQRISDEKFKTIFDAQNKLIQHYEIQAASAAEVQKKIIDKYLEHPCCAQQVIRVTTPPTSKKDSQCDCDKSQKDIRRDTLSRH